MIFESSELERDSITRNFRVVQTEGARQVNREIDHYNLDAIIVQDKLYQSDFDQLTGELGGS